MPRPRAECEGRLITLLRPYYIVQLHTGVCSFLSEVNFLLTSLQEQIQASKIMAQDLNLLSNCKNRLSFMPRVDVDLRLNPIDSSPEIRNLPNEILCTIFESTCAENLLQEYPWPSTDIRPTDCCLPAIAYLPSLAISAVCTRWRSLTLVSPRLWSQLRLETGHSEKALASGFVSTLQLYLNRSVNAPLSIAVTALGQNFLPQNRNSPVLNLLLDHADRWRAFSYAGDYKLEELIGPDLSFPILENLTLGLKGDWVTLRSWNLTLFEDAPKLLTVATQEQITKLPQSWNHITSLQILRPPLPEGMDSLQRYPNLTNLMLSSPRYGFGTGITSLARLESFTLVEFPYAQKGALLSEMCSTMTLPSLTELIIDSDNYKPCLYWPKLDVFRSFISRSMCTLTTLSLCRVSIRDQLLISTFRILPSLVNFCIDDWVERPHRMFGGGSPLTKEFILSMSASSCTPVLPKLHSLSITTYSPSFDEAAFVDMVSSRWLPGSLAADIGIDCLRSLVLRLPTREVDEEIYRPLENLDRMGMQVVVTGYVDDDIYLNGYTR